MGSDTSGSLRLELSAIDAGPFRGERDLGHLEPGLNLIVAPNGAGKSTLMRYIAALDKHRVARGDLVLNDEASGTCAEVRVGAAALSLRAADAVPKRRGLASLPDIEPLPEPVGLLIHGAHRVGDDSAFRARLSGLCRLLELTADDEAVRALVGNDPELRSTLLGNVKETDLVRVADLVRKEAHALRRDAEKAAELAQDEAAEIEGRRLQNLRTALDGEPGSERGSLDELVALVAGVPDADTEAAIRELDRLRDQDADHRAEAARRERLREKLAGAEPPPIERIEAEVEDANANEVAKREELDTARQRVVELRERLRAAEAEQGKVDQEHANALVAQEHARERLAAARRQRDALEAARAELEEDMPPAVPEGAVEAARVRVDFCRRSEQAVKARGVDQQLAAKQDEAQRGRARHLERAAELEAEAHAAWDRLAEYLNGFLHSDRIRVRGERIEAAIGDEWVDIAGDRISEGQRTELCYELMLEHREGNRIILIDGATTLDSENRRKVGDLARQRGVLLVAEAPAGDDDPEWAVEHY